jgi:hypothetical protein
LALRRRCLPARRSRRRSQPSEAGGSTSIRGTSQVGRPEYITYVERDPRRLAPALTLLVAIATAVVPATAWGGGHANPQVTYVIQGHITQYIAPARSLVGSISVIVLGSSRNAGRLNGMPLTCAVTDRTKLVLDRDGLRTGEQAIVKIRAPKRLSAGDLATVSAFEIIDLDARSAAKRRTAPAAKNQEAKPAGAKPAAPPAKRR